MPRSAWEWWAGSSDETFSVGPCASRADVISEGRANFDEGFHIVEARQDPVDVAAHFFIEPLIETLVENIDEQHCDPDGNNVPLFDPSPAEADSLESMIRNEIRRWQELHGIRVRPWLFTAQRNADFIEPEIRDDE